MCVASQLTDHVGNWFAFAVFQCKMTLAISNVCSNISPVHNRAELAVGSSHASYGTEARVFNSIRPNSLTSVTGLTIWGAFVCFPGAIPWEARNMRHSKTLWCVLNRIQRNVIICFVNS